MDTLPHGVGTPFTPSHHHTVRPVPYRNTDVTMGKTRSTRKARGCWVVMWKARDCHVSDNIDMPALRHGSPLATSMSSPPPPSEALTTVRRIPEYHQSKAQALLCLYADYILELMQERNGYGQAHRPRGISLHVSAELDTAVARIYAAFNNPGT